MSDVSWRRRPAGRLLAHLVGLYRRWLSPLKPPSWRCRFVPTCSAYAVDALRTHGAARGLWLTATRLSRCHPLCRGGFDPVPGSRLESDAREFRRRAERAADRHPDPPVRAGTATTGRRAGS